MTGKSFRNTNGVLTHNRMQTAVPCAKKERKASALQTGPLSVVTGNEMCLVYVQACCYLFVSSSFKENLSASQCSWRTAKRSVRRG